MDLKVMTFNLRTIAVKDGDNIWANRVGRVAAAIKQHRPLVFGTQEGHLSMLQDLEPHLPGYAWLGEGREVGRSGEHCAIFYRKDELEAVEQGQFWLSEQPDEPGSKGWDTMCPRICTWARFRHVQAPHRQFVFFNTHLDHKGQEARRRGIAMVWRAIRKERDASGLPILLSGDFNSQPQSEVVRFMRGQLTLEGETMAMTDAYSVYPEPIGRTSHPFSGDAEGNPIDYIFTTPDIVIRSVIIDRGQYEGGYPSDHYPVIAEVTLP
jgi:endonuclease/exonuclease/phosphatase family metal-dependent hydrolase